MVSYFLPDINRKKMTKSVEKKHSKWYINLDMKKINKNKQIKTVKAILIIIWMIVIFNFSNQGGTESSGTSSKVTKVIINVIVKDKEAPDKQTEERIEKVVRKGAHYTIYTIGGLLIMNYAYSMEKTKKQKILGSLLFGAFYAGTDELHQYFVPGRSAQITDVVLDSFGVITGNLLYLLIRDFVENKK